MTDVKGIGHNSGDDTAADSAHSVAAGALRAFIERIERLEEDKKAVADDIKEIYTEAKSTGLDAKTIRKLVQMRKKDTAELQEEQALLELYAEALGMGIFG